MSFCSSLTGQPQNMTLLLRRIFNRRSNKKASGCLVRQWLDAFFCFTHSLRERYFLPISAVSGDCFQPLPAPAGASKSEAAGGLILFLERKSTKKNFVFSSHESSPGAIPASDANALTTRAGRLSRFLVRRARFPSIAAGLRRFRARFSSGRQALLTHPMPCIWKFNLDLPCRSA